MLFKKEIDRFYHNVRKSDSYINVSISETDLLVQKGDDDWLRHCPSVRRVATCYAKTRDQSDPVKESNEDTLESYYTKADL